MGAALLSALSLVAAPGNPALAENWYAGSDTVATYGGIYGDGAIRVAFNAGHFAARSPNGDLHVVYSVRDDGQLVWLPYYRRCVRTPGAATCIWSAPVPLRRYFMNALGTQKGSVSFPNIRVLDDTHYIVIWREEDLNLAAAARYGAIIETHTEDGTSWSAPALVSNAPGPDADDAMNPSIHGYLDSGSMVGTIVWSNEDSTTARAAYWAAGTWSAPMDVGPVGSSYDVAVCGFNAEVMAVWEVPEPGGGGGTLGIQYAYSFNGGAHYYGPFDVYSIGLEAGDSDPSCAFNTGDEAYIAYHQMQELPPFGEEFEPDTPAARVFLARSTSPETTGSFAKVLRPDDSVWSEDGWMISVHAGGGDGANVAVAWEHTWDASHADEYKTVGAVFTTDDFVTLDDYSDSNAHAMPSWGDNCNTYDIDDAADSGDFGCYDQAPNGFPPAHPDYEPGYDRYVTMSSPSITRNLGVVVGGASIDYLDVFYLSGDKRMLLHRWATLP